MPTRRHGERGLAQESALRRWSTAAPCRTPRPAPGRASPATNCGLELRRRATSPPPFARTYETELFLETPGSSPAWSRGSIIPGGVVDSSGQVPPKSSHVQAVPATDTEALTVDMAACAEAVEADTAGRPGRAPRTRPSSWCARAPSRPGKERQRRDHPVPGPARRHRHRDRARQAAKRSLIVQQRPAQARLLLVLDHARAPR